MLYHLTMPTLLLPPDIVRFLVEAYPESVRLYGGQERFPFHSASRGMDRWKGFGICVSYTPKQCTHVMSPETCHCTRPVSTKIGQRSSYSCWTNTPRASTNPAKTAIYRFTFLCSKCGLSVELLQVTPHSMTVWM
jgi:hypothetical protein